MFVARLRDEWEAGLNRFDATGEALFEALDEIELVGVCGLNPDPYSDDPTIGRVRHLYELPRHRRAGISGALVQAALGPARVSLDQSRIWRDACLVAWRPFVLPEAVLEAAGDIDRECAHRQKTKHAQAEWSRVRYPMLPCAIWMRFPHVSSKTAADTLP